MLKAIALGCAAASAFAMSGDGWSQAVHHDDQHSTTNAQTHHDRVLARRANCVQLPRSGWAASIVPAPRWPNGLLIVSGTVTLPGSCFVASLRRGGLTRTQPPSQYFVLDYEDRENCIGGLSTRPITVSTEIPAQPSYQSVVVLCNGSPFVEINRINRVSAPQPESVR
jgi:hypothetical protein